MGVPKKFRTGCLLCGKEQYRAYYKYCSNVCQKRYEYRQYIKSWKEGGVDGISNIGTVNSHVKRFLREKYANKCSLCGWKEVNVATGQVPLVADHIDGNWRNNVESNLRLICPNCDSLLPTYAALNKGNGRSKRSVSNRVKEARAMTLSKRSL